MPDKKTLEYYNNSATDYQRRMAKNEFPFAEEFGAQLQPGMCVLDFGCGPGHHAQYFASLGLDVEGMDASEEMVRLANLNQGVTARVASFSDLDEQDKYDGIWANFSLLHASRDEFLTILSKLKAASKSGGLLHLGMKTGTGTRVDHLGRYYTYYAPEELAEYLANSGFTSTRTEIGSGVGMAGKDEPWVVIWAQSI